MNVQTGFFFPRPGQLEAIKTFYAGINGADSLDPVTQQQSGVWSAKIHCSRGPVLEKAGLAMVEMLGGSVDGASADIRLLQTLAWSVSADVPGLIIMASTSTMEGGDAIITFYADLIAQNGTAGESDKEAFTAAMRSACAKHGRDLAEYQAFLTGRGMLGACAAECGMLYFFEESDAAFLDDCINAALQAYRLILDTTGSRAGGDKSLMAGCRAKIKEWMVTQDYGVKVARQNGIPDDVMGIYGFPPGV